MFDNCTTLEQLNAKRRELVMAGTPVTAVNAAYNKARKSLMEARQVYKRVASYAATPPKPRGYAAYHLKEGVASKHELIMGDNVIYI